MTTVNLLRYSSATTEADFRRELESADSGDHGDGRAYNGLCCAIEDGQQPLDLLSYLPALLRDQYYLDNQAVTSAVGLAAYIHTQGCKRRTMWRITVDVEDIVGLADRYMPGRKADPASGKVYPSGTCLVDGVVLRKGCCPIALAKVRIDA